MKNMNRLSKLSVLIVTAVTLSACGKMDFSQTDLTSLVPNLPNLKPSAQGMEAVSGATMAKRTAVNHYYVDTSVGAPRDQIDARTAGGYYVFHGVKGAIVSDGSTAP